MPETSETLTVTVPEFAKAVGMAETTVYAAIARGEIVAIRIGRAVRVPRRVLQELLEPQESK